MYRDSSSRINDHIHHNKEVVMSSNDSMHALYAEYPVTRQVLQEKHGIVPEVQKKRNQCDWFSLAVEAKGERIRNNNKSHVVARRVS
jgi:hypothetical protein